MNKQYNRLTARFVNTIQSPGSYWDYTGTGLYLSVKKSKKTGRINKSYAQRISIRGKQRIRVMGLGSARVVSLADARKAANENQELAHKGIDPLQQRKQEQRKQEQRKQEQRKQTSIPTFEDAAHEVLENFRPSWTCSRHAGDWKKSLERYVMPTFGSMLVSEIELDDVIHVLKPIWYSHPQLAKHIRQRIGSVMLWAVAHKYREDNPASAELVKAILPNQKHKPVHMRALHYSEVQHALEQVRAKDLHAVLKLCFEFLVLTATRSEEARGVVWLEIDLETATWIIPKHRMKGRLEHRVPLSSHALNVLKQAQELDPHSELIFPSVRKKKIITGAIMSNLPRNAGVDSTVHGFRSSFRQWAAEQTSFPREVCELALAHVNRDRVEAAYQRSDLFEQRRKLMNAWAQYINSESATILELPVQKR